MMRKYTVNKIIGFLLHPINTLNRIYQKFYVIPRYKKIHAQTHREFIAYIFKNHVDDYLSITEEILKDQSFNEVIKKEFILANIRYYPLDELSWPVTLYYLLRKTKPKVFVETGCLYGVSTSYILAALNK